MTDRIVAIAVGNPSRGDDALGPLLLERIAAEFPDVIALCDFQLQIEHALDLGDADRVLFIDAATGLEVPFTFTEIGPDAGNAVLTHALSPAAVLDVFERVEGRAPPPAFVLALQGIRFGLGEPVSANALAALETAWRFIRPLLSAPGVEDWRARTVPDARMTNRGADSRTDRSTRT
jgi:hydrogenase maturation protease